MNGRLQARLSRLEQRVQPTWGHLAGLPVQQWPDEALHAVICDDLGIPRRCLTDDELQAILEGCPPASLRNDM